MSFTLAPPPPAPPAPAASMPAAAPAPAPPVLSIAVPKPLRLKVGKWRSVKLKVTNTGATTTSVGSLRLKAPAGVVVKPVSQQVPVLLPGGSITLSVRVELTKKAKKKSTVSLSGSAPGATGARGSLVLKLEQ
jgi:hypothetical protein